MINYSKQQRQHEIENKAMQRLANYCKQHNMSFIDTHIGTAPYDCIIDNIYYYDVKATDKRKLSYRRTLPDGYTYDPIAKHTRVPYLIIEPNGKCYKISKQELRDYIDNLKQQGKLEEETTIYDGDGNINTCVNISYFINDEHLLFDISNNKDVWQAFISRAGMI